MSSNAACILPPVVTFEDIRSGLGLYWKPGEVHEIRGLADRPELFGFFDSQDRAAAAILRHAKTPGLNFYLTMNPVNPDLLARAANTLKKPKSSGRSASDRDVIQRTKLVFDFDPRRPSGISATEDQVKAARACAVTAYGILNTEFGWPAPLCVVMSGNGLHLIFDIDLSNDEPARKLLEDVLRTADVLFSTEAVSLDATMFNASRIIKVPGTIARKGDNTPDRPHRLACVISKPKHSGLLSRAQLDRFAASVPPMEAPGAMVQHAAGSVYKPFDLITFLQNTGVAFKGPCPISQGEKFVLDHCFFDESHTATSAAVIRRPDGKLGYICQHNSCRDRHWQDVRKRYDGPTQRRSSAEGIGEHLPVQDWPELIRLDALPVQRITREMLPGFLGPMAEAVARATETPLELAALMGCSAVALSIAGKVEVSPAKNDYRETTNLYICAAMESGNRKSAVLDYMAAPILEVEKERSLQIKPERDRLISDRKTLEAQIDRLRKQKPGPSEPLAAIHAKIHDLESQLPEVPSLPQFWSQDITPEHLGTKLAEQNGRIGLLSAEGGIFENFAGRYSKGIPNLDLLLQGHEGSPARVERGSRAVYLHRPTITICIAPQPDVLKSFSKHPEFRGRGVVARFLYALPQSLLGIRTHDTAPVLNLIREDYHSGIKALLNMPIERSSDGRPVPGIIYLSKQALPQWKDFQRVVESQLLEGQRLSRCTDWAGKLPGQALRLAAVLHYAVYPFGNGPKEIQLEQTEQALALAGVLTTHTLAALQLMELDPAVEDARRILRWIRRIGKPEFTIRDCFHSHQGHFKRVDSMDPAMAVLLRHGYVRPLPQEKKLGRPTGLYEVNPSVFRVQQ